MSKIPVRGDLVKKKKPNERNLTAIQLKKMRFTQEINQLYSDIFEEKRQKLLQEKKNANLQNKRSEMQKDFDQLIQKAEDAKRDLMIKLSEIEQENNELAERLERLKQQKATEQKKDETNEIQKRAEEDLETQLHSEIASLETEHNRLLREITEKKDKKVDLKKKYKRVKDTYEALLRRVKQIALDKEVKKKKKELEKINAENEQRMKEEAERKKNPINVYKNILYNAGYNNETYDIPIVVHEIDDPVEINSMSGDLLDESEIYNEPNEINDQIRILLSTGQYTEADPIIRELKSLLKKD